MGNSLRLQPASTRTDEDCESWDTMDEHERLRGYEGDCESWDTMDEHESLGGYDGKEEAKPCNQIKMKFTKKQLEELLCQAELHGLTVQQVLTSLARMNGRASGRSGHCRGRVWRPKLHAIPEFS